MLQKFPRKWAHAESFAKNKWDDFRCFNLAIKFNFNFMEAYQPRSCEKHRTNLKKYIQFIRYSKTRDAGMKMSCNQMSFCSGKIAECNTMGHVDMESALEIRKPVFEWRMNSACIVTWKCVWNRKIEWNLVSPKRPKMIPCEWWS